MLTGCRAHVCGMTKLNLTANPDSASQDLVELLGAVHRDLVAYAELLGRETGG